MPTPIILAAGRGRRLGQVTEARPKCLLPVGRLSLLERQLATLRSFGLQPVVVVTGYRAEGVAARVDGQATCLVNARHATTNSLYSLWLAREYAQRGFVLLNGDVLFDPEILQRVLDCPHPDALAVERRTYFEPEEMKVGLAGDRIRAMSKSLAPARAHAENVGVLKFSAAGARLLFQKIEALLPTGAEKEFCPYAFNALAGEYPLHAVPVEGLPWIEIDFIEDLLRARREVWPAILARHPQQDQPSLSDSQRAANPPPVLRN